MFQKDNKKDISVGVLPFQSEHGVHDELSSHAQKIATAIYLITGLMDIHDPLRNRLRLKALDVMSFISSYSNLNDKKAKVSFEDVVDGVQEAMSLIEVGSSAGVISAMNGDILARELRLLTNAFDTYTKMSDIQNSALGTLFSNGLSETLQIGVYKGHSVPDKSKGQKKTHHVIRKQNVFEKKTHPRSESGTGERKEKILSVVREKGNVMIKDISKHIPNCSEKTIQRDLIDLVSQGLLEKRGERRWTTYFVHNA
jgi:hypothetical protein